MTKARLGFLVFAVFSLLFGGCSGPSFRGGMNVSLVDFKPTEASLLESRGILTLRFTNETIAPLGYSGSSHKLYLNGRYVGRAVSDRPFGVPPLNTVTQDVSVQFENLALIRQLASVGESKTATYRLETVLFQTIAEEKYDYKVQTEGSIDLHSFAEAAK